MTKPPPTLPDTARSILKSVIVSLSTTGLITWADADFMIRVLGLADA